MLYDKQNIPTILNFLYLLLILSNLMLNTNFLLDYPFKSDLKRKDLFALLIFQLIIFFQNLLPF